MDVSPQLALPWVIASLLVASPGCTGRLAMGGRVTGAPFATPGESQDRGALATTGDLAMGLGWSEDREHAFVPESRLQGGGLWAEESAGVVQSELGFNYTWLPRRADIGVRAMALGGSGFLIGPERKDDGGEGDSDDPARSGLALHVGAAMGAYLVQTDRSGGGGGKGVFIGSPARTTSGVSVTVGVLRGFDETEGPLLFLAVDWELLTFGD